jgi:hypothetical protein
MKTARTFLIVALAAHTLAGVPRAKAEPILFHVHNVTISLTCVSREVDALGQNALVTRILTNKQIINLAQGRDPAAVVPANEVLVAFAPDDYTKLTTLRVALMDKTTSTIIKLIGTTNSSEVAYGPPNGYAAQGVGTGTMEALSSPAFSIGQIPLSLSFTGSEKPIRGGTIQTFKLVSVSAPVALTVNGTPVPGLIRKGNVRLAAKVLFDLNDDL